MINKIRSDNPLRSGYYSALLAITVCGGILRLLHVSVLYYSATGGDMPVYLAMAREAFGDGLWRPGHSLFPPGFPLFLRLVSWGGAGYGIKPVLYTQVFVDSLAILALASYTRYIAGAKCSLLVALAYAFYRIAIVHAGLLYSESLAGAFIVFTLCGFAYYSRKPSVWRACVFGAVAGCSTLVRTNTLPLLIVGLAYTASPVHIGTKGRSLRLRIIHAFVALLTAACVLAPWAYRNSVVMKRPSFIAVNAGMNLFQGNNPLADGGWFSRELPAWYMDRATKGALDEIDGMKKAGLRFAVSNPAYEAFYLIPSRLKYLFWEVPDSYFVWDDPYMGGNYLTFPFGPYFWVPLLPFTPVFVLGSIGLFLRGRRLPYFNTAGWFSLALPLLCFHANNRFRGVSDSLLIVSACMVLVRVASSIAFRSMMRRVTLVLGVLSVFATGINYCRFGGGNMLIPTNSHLLDSTKEMNKAVSSTLALNIEASPAKKREFFLGSLAVDPGIESHLLVRFKYRVRKAYRSPGCTLDLTFKSFDEMGATVTLPIAPDHFLPNSVDISTDQEQGNEAWRIVRLRAFARRFDMYLTFTVSGEFEIWDMQVRGPIWVRLRRWP